ncbi:MAG TPA: PKD domain-containing protein, partial [Thermoplasmata archaeon]|nr:PKD domain-containing protein [Thermoplasmata archaeon]
GGTWSLLTTAVGPDTRGGPGLAYDAAAGAVVMYGGFPANTYYDATWVLKAGVWTHYAVTPTPGAGTIWGQMAYDAADQYVVLLQGDGAYNGTWELNFTSGGSPPPLSVTATATPTSGTVPLAVAFAATASGGTSPYSYSWNFGDASTSTSQNPSHTYERAGSFSATLNVTDSASGKVSKSWTIVVSAAALQASISAEPTTAAVNQTVTFTSTVSGGTSQYTYLWEFSDHSSSTSANPSHSFGAAGSYLVTFVVNDSHGSSVRRNVTITVTASTNPNQPASASTPIVTWIAVGALLIIVIVFVAFLLYRRRRKPDATAPPAVAPPAPPPPS